MISDSEHVIRGLATAAAGSASCGPAGGGVHACDGGGAESSNTPPANSHYAGIDTLHIGFGVSWPNDGDEVFEVLDVAKRAASDDEQLAAGENRVCFGGDFYEVQATGKGGAQYMAYALLGNGIRIYIQHKTEPHGETPNVMVIAGSQYCLMRGGVDALFADVRRRVSSFGGDVLFDKVSRVDLFCDLPQDVGTVCEAFSDDRFVTRARDWGLYGEGRRKTGVTVGKSIMFRAYDKRHELKGDSVKRATWENVEWDGDVPEHVTRFEFELKREPLKSLQVDGLSSLRERLVSIWDYLTCQWLRVAAAGIDRTHTSRVESEALAGFWRAVQGAYRGVLQKVKDVCRATVRRLVDVDALLRQAWGCMEAAAAVGKVKIHAIDDFMQFAERKLWRFALRERDGKENGLPVMWSRITRKRQLLEARADLGCSWYPPGFAMQRI